MPASPASETISSTEKTTKRRKPKPSRPPKHKRERAKAKARAAEVVEAAVGVVDVVITETVNVSFVGGKAQSYAVRGEVHLVMNPPPEEESSFVFQFTNEDSFASVAPNPECLTSSTPGEYCALLQAQQTNVCVLKYVMNTHMADAATQIPIVAEVSWNHSKPMETSVAISYRTNALLHHHVSFSDVKFLVVAGPKGTVSKCAGGKPRCMWNTKSHKLMWKANLSTQDDNLDGRLTARLLLEEDKAASQWPVELSFTARGFAPISGLGIHDLGRAHSTTPRYALRNVQCFLRAGVYTFAP